MSLRILFGRACHETRIRLDLTQQALATAVGVSRSYITRVERGQANLTLDVVERIADRLGQHLELTVTPPVFLAIRGPHDRVHAWCVEMVARRFRTAGWLTAREVEVHDGRTHGWIDLLAFNPRTRVLLIIEVKTRLDDLGGLQRQVAWYERHEIAAARGLGWQAEGTSTWLIALASDEIEAAIAEQRSLFDSAFPGRAGHMLDLVRGAAQPGARSVALVDPHSKRRDWLIRTRLDGRRSALPYRNYADAARRISG